MPIERVLFVLWSNARTAEDQILEMIDGCFDVHRVIEVTWSPELIAENYGRFYKNRLSPPYRRSLVRQKGEGPFLVLQASDTSPTHVVRETASGRTAVVNARSHDLKAQIRELLDGSMSIHSADSQAQATRESLFLTGKHGWPGGRWTGSVPALHSDPVGARGWPGWADLADGLREVNYLRLPGDPGAASSFLAEDYRMLSVTANARPIDPRVEKTGGQHHVEVADRIRSITIRYPGDGFISRDLAESALESAAPREGVGFKRATPDLEAAVLSEIRGTHAGRSPLPRDPMVPLRTQGLSPSQSRRKRWRWRSRRAWRGLTSPLVSPLDRSWRTIRERLRLM